jgi:hypothetical protein
MAAYIQTQCNANKSASRLYVYAPKVEYYATTFIL